MNSHGHLVSVASLLLLILAACSADGGPAAGDKDHESVDLSNTRWQLVSFTESGSEIPAVEETAVTLIFQADAQAGGSGGCNTFGAQVQVTGSRIAFSEIVSTLMACTRPGVDEQERRYFEALGAAGEFEWTGNRLTIHYDDGRGELNFIQMGG
jgi:heat shock protein HslJ